MVTETSHYIEHPSAIALPITSEHRQAAQHFAQRCPFAEKASQIERNTLAVCAVNAYLQMMGIETDLASSDSWNPMMQTMADVADLAISNVGSLSCRALAPTDEACYVPPEDWSDRAGYVAVVIDSEASQALLLGFTPTVESEQVAIAQFAPIETLLDHIHTLKTQSSSAATQVQTATAQAAAQIRTQINDWVRGVLTDGWQLVDELINPPQTGYAFRSAANTNLADTPYITRAKAIDISAISETAYLVALVMQLVPAEQRSSIVVQVRPMGAETNLPEGIILSILDENNTLITEATSRAIDNYIQLQIAGESGDRFIVQIRKQDTQFEEQFEL